MPRALGSMMLRPGIEYTGATKSNLQSVTIPFVKATSPLDAARLEMTNTVMRVWVDDALVTRASVTSAVANGAFTTNLTSWSDQDGGSSVSAWVDGTALGLTTGGYLSLIGTTTAAAKRRQQVTCAGGNIGVRHALNVVIARGPVHILVGSTAGGGDYIAETVLETGYHSLAFTPSGDFYIDLFSYTEAASVVDSIAVASSGTMEITAPWLTADLANLRWDQSGDVVFVACDGYRQRRIERREDAAGLASDSWSIVEYKSDDGPFMVQNVGPITITPAATSGDTTLTASASLFKSTHVGALFRLTHTGQLEDASLTGANQFSDPIRIIGVDGTRNFSIFITGTFVATVTLQYSVAAPGDWVDATSGSFTAPASEAYDDTLDNQEIYYRIGIKAGDYTSGTADVTLSVSSGSQAGIARITGYTSATVVTAAVIAEFANTTATDDWSESYWSGYRGYPSSVALGEGRLWWFGRDRNWGSISDAYDSFDDEFEGDAGPISRSIGTGPVETTFWAIAVNRLLIGTGGDIKAIRSSSLDEPITPTNFNIKGIDTPADGSANVGAAKSGTSALYVQQAGTRLYEASVGDNGYDYQASDLAVHVPEIGEPGLVKIVVQHQPEKRVHCIRSDGTVGILVYDKAEDVKCWVDFETAGDVEDAVVIPGTVEDSVYYTIKRTINGSTVRYHEKWALESECQGGTLNKQADSFITGTGAVDGLDHLEGEDVVVWADGEDQGTFTVTSGDTGESFTSWVAGLAYDAEFKSTKLAYAVADGTALTAKKRVFRLGIVARNIHPQGLMYGPDFTTMDDMPLIEDGTSVVQTTVREAYDEPAFAFPGEWDTDARLCLKASAPRPCTLLAAVLVMDTNG